MPYETLIPLIPLLPILGFGFTALFGRRLQLRYGRQAAEIVPVGLVIAIWVIAMIVVVPALQHTDPFPADKGLDVKLWTWIPAGNLQVDMGFHVDALTACLLIVVTTIGMLVHIYSIGYMAHDKATWRFFAYLNLFMFSMLILVLANNWLLVFAGWELVGLSSYALIGFWYHKRSAALAAKKAFIVNRVGDVGFALGIMAIFVNTGTLNIQESLAKLIAPGAVLTVPVTIVALLVFAGAMGKSAQFPLHVWLPDAMEGPTPVSALIHAATMVNAGVYLIARANPLFSSAPEAMVVVAGIGIFTAILAASIAFTQTDIKRVLAFSTLSQLGYMFAALGVGAYAAAIFHLMSHGFFKGLLFLGSGSVIHSVDGEQDMNRMGGLWRKMPITHATMLVGALAMAGLPPLVPFFSKDEILGASFRNGFYWVWAVGLLVAGMTAFYMFRLMGKTFYGPSHVDEHVHPHEAPRSMWVPLVLLATPIPLLGLAVGWPPDAGLIHRWLGPVFAPAEATLGLRPETFQLVGLDGLLVLVSVTVAAIGLVGGARLFGLRLPGRDVAPQPSVVEAGTRRLRPLYIASFNKWWFDTLYHGLFFVIGGAVARASWWFDVHVIDGAVNGVASVTQFSGRELRRIQTGRVQNYALGIALGLIVMAAGFLWLAASR